MTAQSDAQLATLAQGGDVDAFGQLVRRWDPELRGVVWSVLRNQSGTDDVLQSAYEKALRSLPTFRGESSLNTWLHTICYRTAIDHLRFEQRRRHEPAVVLDLIASPGSTSGTALARGELAAVLEGIEPEARALLMLTAGLGYSFDEAAEVTGLPRGTVASKVRRARMALNEDRPDTNTDTTDTSNRNTSKRKGMR